jgi:L-fuculose-phosphate aldolase
MLGKEKELLIEYGRKMVDRRLTVGSGGNLSIVDRAAGCVAITPSGIEYHDMRPDQIVVCDRQGEIREGGCKPSSEIGFHLALYTHRNDIGAVVHTHSVYATTIACLGREIPPVHYLVGFAGPKVPLAPYATFGTPELARVAVDAIGEANAVLLANHGLIAVGATIAAAFTVAEEIEFVARVYYQALVAGDPQLLSQEQMDAALRKFKTYWQQ